MELKKAISVDGREIFWFEHGGTTVSFGCLSVIRSFLSFLQWYFFKWDAKKSKMVWYPCFIYSEKWHTSKIAQSNRNFLSNG